MASLCEEDNESASTTKATKASKTIFQDYLNEKEIRFPEKSEELAAILPKFFFEVRKKDGSQYTKNSLCALRFGLNRYFRPLFKVDIIKDKSFDEASKAYEAHCKNLKDIGLDKAEHKPPISDEDIKKLYESGLFSTDCPSTLQNKVFFELILYFCRRSRQNLRQLRKDDFVVKINPQGQKYVVKSGDTTKLDVGHEGGMMVASDSPLCPVFSFEKYLTHLNPLNEFLFQRPRANWPGGIVWYDNIVIGENTLGKKMRVISAQAKLSVEYTNHSIRATTISILNRHGYLAKHIMDISGHKSENSITKFCNRTSQNSKTKMADCLLSAITHAQKLSGSIGNESAAVTISDQTKKRKLDDEFSKESSKNEDLHIAVPIATRITVTTDNRDENVAPEEHPTLAEASKSRRKAPRSQVRKVVRTDIQSNAQDETSVIATVGKSETTSKESLEEPRNHERQVENMVQDTNNTTTCTSPRNENINIQTVSESGISSSNVASETTVIEEDYQRKYFQLLNTMNDLQNKFLNSQRNFEDLVKAREAFIEELKCKLENNHQEIDSIKQELATSNNKISELEEKRKMYEKNIQNLSEKVEGMKVREESEVFKDREAELQETIEKQQEVLDFYKILTSVTVEKVVEDENEPSPNVYDKFRCSVKTAQTQELQFLLTHDPEFAEVEYTPLSLDSLDSSFPQYLNEHIFFESSQAPNFLRRLIQTFQNLDEK